MAKDQYESHDELDATVHTREGMGTGVLVATAIALLLSIYFIQKAMGDKFNAGMFGKPASPVAPR